MKRRNGLILLAVGMLCCTCVWAQNDTGSQDNQPPTQPGPQPAFTYPDTTPSLDFITGSIENSSVALGLNAGFAYDSNAYPTSVSPNSTQDRWLTNLGASIHLQEYRPKLSWNAGYRGGLQIYNQISGPGNSNSNNRYAQSASAGFLWQLARTWQLAANDQYVYSADPFDSFLTIPGNPTSNNPNAVSYFPLTQFTTNLGTLTLTDRLSKTDTLTFTGTSNLRRTSTYNVVTSVPFYNLITYGGRMDYSHQFSARLSFGAGYDFNSLDFGHGQQRSGIQTISLTGSYLIRPNMTIAFWVGPEYTSTKSIVGVPIGGQIFYFTNYDSLWSTALGFNYGWQGKHNSARAGFSRQVNDGGGIIATSQTNSLSGGYRHGFSSKLSGDVSGRWLYSVSTTANARHYYNYSVSASVNYQFNKSFAAAANYMYIHQQQSAAFLLNGNNHYTDNRVGFTVNYTWNHPLGR